MMYVHRLPQRDLYKLRAGKRMSMDSKGNPGKKTLLMSILRNISKQKQTRVLTIQFEKLATRFGVDESEVLTLFNQMKNDAYRQTFLSTPYRNRIILFPQCLRHPDCEAKSDKWGHHCVDCGRCGISRIKKLADGLGYAKVFIIRGGSIIVEIFEKFRPKAVIGIACDKEIFLGNLVTEKYDVVSQGVILTKEGCYNTEVNWKQVEKCIRSINPSTDKESTEKEADAQQ